MLDDSESGSSNQLVKKQGNNDVHGYVICVHSIAFGHHWLFAIFQRVYTYGVGFGVARSNLLGDARASVCGTSNR